MKKKILAITLCVAMLAIMLVSGTLAYFTDTDAATNVMTTGKVNIRQNEQQRGESGLEEFVDNKALMPMVDTRAEGEATVVDGYFNSKMNNVVDKIITVTNEANAGAINQDAYVRTILAFETTEVYEAGTDTVIGDAHYMYIGTLGDFEYVDADPATDGVQFSYITVNGVKYVLAVKVYENVLGPTQETEPSLKQIFMAPTANNEVMDLFGEAYTILALSQGTQVAGFENAATALDTAFGAVNAANCQNWFLEIA